MDADNVENFPIGLLLAVAAAVGAGVLCVACRSWLRRCKWRRVADSTPPQPVPEATQPAQEPVVAEEPAPAPVSPETQPEPEIPADEQEGTSLQEAAGAFGQEDLRELVMDRLAMAEENGEGTEQWAMDLVDLLDELRWMGGLDAADKDRIPAFCSKTKQVLEAAGGELIDDDAWDPARQRAVKISKTLPEGAEPRITRKGATGLIFKGRLLRKQEVSLEKAP